MYQCYYKDKNGERCKEKTENYWCSDKHKNLWQEENYPEKKSTFKNERTISEDKPNEYLISKGYVRLELGSYRRWVYKRWHEMFVSKKLVAKNSFGQFVPVRDKANEFGNWLSLYDRYMDALDWNRNLSKEDAEILSFENLFIKNTSQRAVVSNG